MTQILFTSGAFLWGFRPTPDHACLPHRAAGGQCLCSKSPAHTSPTVHQTALSWQVETPYGHGPTRTVPPIHLRPKVVASVGTSVTIFVGAHGCAPATFT